MSRKNHITAVGTYGTAFEKSVHTVAVDADTGATKRLDAVAAGPDPTFVAFHPSGECLFATVREDEEGVISLSLDHRPTIGAR